MSSEINELAMKIIGKSFVYAVGLKSCSPTIKFVNNESSSYSCLRIFSKFHITPELDLPKELSAEHKESIMLLELDTAEVESLNCAKNGDLTIKFVHDLKLWVEGNPKEKDIYEPWILINETDKTTLICQNGGSYASTQGN